MLTVSLPPSLRRLAAAAVLCLAATAALAAPAHLIITVPATAPVDLTARLTAWKKAGSIAGAQLLSVVRGAKSADTVDPNPNLGAVAILEFADGTALARWQKSADAKLTPGLTATRVDLISRREVTPRDSPHAVYLMAEYDIMAPPARYKEYVDGYVAPQLEAWQKSGLITSAAMYVARNRAGAPFHGLLVLEHRDEATFSRRDAVKDESRAQLAANPAWKALSDVKTTIRTEKFLTRATSIPLN